MNQDKLDNDGEEFDLEKNMFHLLEWIITLDVEDRV